MDIIEEIEEITHDNKLALSFLFRISMWWRIIYGVFRVFLSTILFKLVGTPFSELFYRLMSHEEVQRPSDRVFQFIYEVLQNHSFTITYFVASYLLFWGIVDIFLSISLLRHKLWAFPISLTLITFFVLYEMYRITYTHSIILLWVIIIDIVIALIINREYKVLKEERAKRFRLKKKM